MKLFNLVYSWKIGILAAALFFTIWNISTLRSFAQDTVSSSFNTAGLRGYFAKLHHRSERLAKIDTKSVVYDEIFRETTMFNFLKKNSFDDRCRIYFNHLFLSNPEWKVDPEENVKIDRGGYRSFDSYRDEYRKNEQRAAEEAEKKNEKPEPALTDEQIKEKYTDLRTSVLADEQTLHDFVSHVRVFDKCYMRAQNPSTKAADDQFVRVQRTFLSNDVKFVESETDSQGGRIYDSRIPCNDVEQKIFPWLTNEFPVFTRHDGKTSYFPGREDRGLSYGDCFLNEYKRRLNGKGIVMTIGDSHIDEAVRFLRILRFFRNPYPVQVVYHSNLSDESKEKLIKAARNAFREYPKQELWFVNAQRSIDGKYIGKFGGFANKVMATFFNSFEEMILCDADAVLLKDPKYFFTLKKYIQKGTMFYKDRGAHEYRGGDDITFFKKLMPSLEDSIVFNIPQTTNNTLDNEFFNGATHYMESGVVVLNRKKHFMQPLMMSVMNFYSPIVHRIYGDKELFWLALVFTGHDDIAFNNNFAASIGEFTPESERQKDIGEIRSFKSKEICSNHPAHISDEDDHTLVWFNSGFRHCGNVLKSQMNFDDEFSRGKRYTKLKSVEEFRTFFGSKMIIKNAVIPPYDSQHRSLRNVEHEPETPWVMTSYCLGYCWCAYSSIGGYYEENGETKSNQMNGKTVTFTDAEVAHFDTLGEIWLAPT